MPDKSLRACCYAVHRRRCLFPGAAEIAAPAAVANAGRSEIERDFARVFSMTGAQGRERLIKRWMDRSGCERTEAMRLATEEWRRDNR
jgi:hypothetical protein